MGKSNKKSATKVGAAPAAIVPVKSLTKGKRDAKDDIEKKLTAKKQKKDAVIQKVEAEEASGSDSSDFEEELTEPAVPVKKQVAAKNGKVAPPAKKAEPANSDESLSGDESASDEENDDDEQPTDTKESSGDESSEEQEEDEESEEEEAAPKKKSKTPAAQAQEEPKTLFLGNLSYKVERADIESFFEDAGGVVDVRLAQGDDGRFKGFGHVDFESAEVAKKALKLNGQELLGREIKLDLAHERGTPQGGKTNNQSGGGAQSQTIFVKGFDSSVGEDEIKSSLREHFGTCGKITRISVPTDRDTGAVKGIAYMDMSDSEAYNKALELNGTDMGGDYLTVDEAKPRDSNNSRGGFGGRGRGGRGGGGRGRGGGGGRFGGGGRSGGGGRGGGRGRGGFGGRGGGRGRY